MARIIDAPLTGSEASGCDPRAAHGSWGALDAAAKRGLAYSAEVRAEIRRALQPRQTRYPRFRVAGLCATDRRHQPHEARQERGNPRA